MYLDKFSLQEQVEKAQDLVNCLVMEDENGNTVPRPGITVEQLKAAIELVKKLKSIKNDFTPALQEIAKENEENEVLVSKIQERMLKSEKRDGIKFNSILRSMFGLE